MERYTFDFICDSQYFEHTEKFVLAKEHDAEIERLNKKIEQLDSIIRSAMMDARETYDEDWLGVDDTTHNGWYVKAWEYFKKEKKV